MPLFNEASRIYTPGEINVMRDCFSQAAILLEESNSAHTEAELATCIMKLYESGLREPAYIAQLSARLAHSKFRPDADNPNIQGLNEEIL
ncbi:hypothetical protein AAIB41_11920 [Brucella sp. BE17]|uniref:hypothetical protein n=1 Tax=Brucella sp. BE17 TaxID=3142977 RepID=UPI0031BB4037